MRIRWKDSYFPHGGWISELHGELSHITPGLNFHATFEDRPILVVMSLVKTPAGHGEGAMEGYQPQFLDATTLERLSEFESEWTYELPWIDADFDIPEERTIEVWLKREPASPTHREKEPARLWVEPGYSLRHVCDKLMGNDPNYNRERMTYAGRRICEFKDAW